MVAQRAGYTVTMFVIDVSKSMGNKRAVEFPNGRTIEMTHLEWALQFVKIKVQEMIFDGRKTDQCGVILFGTKETSNEINAEHEEGYENVFDYIEPGTPDAGTLARLNLLASDFEGDSALSRWKRKRKRFPIMDALIVALQKQNDYLGTKKTWTRKMFLITDGESAIDQEAWEATAAKFDSYNTSLAILGVDFDDEEFDYKEENKSETKAANEKFLRTFIDHLAAGDIANMGLALREVARPDIKVTKSVLSGTVLRVGDVDTRPEEALEVYIKTSKCTALQRPKSWKKFAKRDGVKNGEETYVQLEPRSVYFFDRRDQEERDAAEAAAAAKGDDAADEMNVDEEDASHVKIDKDQLVKGFKYGSSFVPTEAGEFDKLTTKQGMEICGFFKAANFRPELALGEVYFVYGDPVQPQYEMMIDSISRAMDEGKYMAISRWVSKDGADPKMGVLAPSRFDTDLHCLMWTHMPFADDVRKYSFPSLTTLISKKGEALTSHPYLPTPSQQSSMDAFVDSMDLMSAGERDEDGARQPWFDPRLSYNPAIHRVKQALFHSALVNDVVHHPADEPHPELLKYFQPPKRVLKRAHDQIEDVRTAFGVKEVPKRIVKARKDGHVAGIDIDIFAMAPPTNTNTSSGSRNPITVVAAETKSKPSKIAVTDEGSDTEDEDEIKIVEPTKPPARNNANPMPTPARSLSPSISYDLGRAPGRIIGTTYPLDDFKTALSRGDLVSKAVEDLGNVILEILGKPFGLKRSGELVGCMREFRRVAVTEDEVDSWNAFLTDLKKATRNNAFWKEVQGIGRDMSLISKNEVSGLSNVSENEAEEFVR